jgi:DNA-binding protein H-NS
MSAYQEILSQIEDLKRKAEEVRQQEMAGAIAEIKRLMAQFGISSDDLGFSGRGNAAKGKSRGIVAAKYRDPVSGKTWTGRGRRPSWVLDLEAAGKTLDDCRV